MTLSWIINNDYFFYLFGDEDLIRNKIQNYKNLKKNYKIFDTKIIVSDELDGLVVLSPAKQS